MLKSFSIELNPVTELQVVVPGFDKVMQKISLPHIAQVK